MLEYQIFSRLFTAQMVSVICQGIPGTQIIFIGVSMFYEKFDTVTDLMSKSNNGQLFFFSNLWMIWKYTPTNNRNIPIKFYH